MNIRYIAILTTLLVFLFLNACDRQKKKDEAPPKPLQIGMVLDTGGDKDHGFNEYSVLGARKAALELGLEFDYLASESTVLFERNIDKLIAEGSDLIFTVGFPFANSTAKAALQYPHIRFVIVDFAFSPGNGCPENVSDCYTPEGGLQNVTSLLFSEEQPGYLAGVLAGCMSKTGIVASVAGYDIPPVVNYVQGFQNGARAVRSDITTFNRYIPDFNDINTGRVVANNFITEKADVLFCPAGNTGLGGLLAAKEAGIMSIGVDVDQYLTFPEAGSSLITSAMKNMDIAVQQAVQDFAHGRLQSGVRNNNLSNGAVGLAPFHEWEERIPPQCRKLIEQARQKIMADPGLPLRKNK